MILVELFIAFFKIGLFTIGGAYSFIPLVEREVVLRHGWLTANEFLEVIGMTQILPGGISIKFATYVGYKEAGIPGVLAANLGNILPPAVLMVGVMLIYKHFRETAAMKGAFNLIRIAVFSMIIAVAFRLFGIGNLTSFKSIILAACFLVLFLAGRIHPAFIIVGAGILGALFR